MSNKTDRRFLIYLGDQYNVEATPGTATLPSTQINLCDWLEPMYMSVSAGEICQLRCIAHKHPEDAWDDINEDQLIELHEFSVDENGDDQETVVFRGVIPKFRLVYDGSSEQFEVVAYSNADWLLYRIGLHGQIRRNYTYEQGYFTNGANDSAQGLDPMTDLAYIDTPLIFNPDGEPNATEETFFDNTISDSPTYHIFEVPFRNQKNSTGLDIKAVPWKLSWAIAYLLGNNKTSWAFDPTSYSDSILAALFNSNTRQDPVIKNVNLEGKNLFEALSILLEPYNYGFWCEPNVNDDKKHKINFFYKGGGDEKSFKLSQRDTNALDSDANMIRCDLTWDWTPCVNTIYAFGDYKRLTIMAASDPATTELKLVKSWKDIDLNWTMYPSPNDLKVNTVDPTFRKNYCHPELITVLDDGVAYGIGRMWLVNQGQSPNRTLEDLTTKIGGDNGEDLRQLEKPYLFDINSEGGLLHKEDVQVEVSTDEGDNWCVVEKSKYKILTQGMGIVFSDPFLENLTVLFKNSNQATGVNYWQSLHDDTLRVRILCSVRSDEKIAVRTTNGGTTKRLATMRVYDNPGYKKIEYDNSINSSVFYTKYSPEKVTLNDTSAFNEIAIQQAVNTDRRIVSGSATLVLDKMDDWKPGQVITAIDNRVDMDVPYPTIMRVVYDFPNKHVTLVLDNRLVNTVINTKNTVGEDLRSHQLGVSGMTDFGGQQVPFIQGLIGGGKGYKQSVIDRMGTQ